MITNTQEPVIVSWTENRDDKTKITYTVNFADKKKSIYSNDMITYTSVTITVTNFYSMESVTRKIMPYGQDYEKIIDTARQIRFDIIGKS